MGKIWKWVVAHAGTHLFDDCEGDLPYGPCPGICFNTNSPDSYPIMPYEESKGFLREDYADGNRLMQVALFNDSTLGISFTHDDLIYKDSLYIYENFNLGEAVSEMFKKDSIIMLKGVYPVSFSHGRNGATIVNVITY